MKSCFFAILFLISAASYAQDSTYKELVGKYKFPAGTIIEEAIVTVTSGVVSMSSAQGISVLEKIKGDTFNVVSFNGFCVFKRNEAQKIIGVHVDASGYIMDGVKDEGGYNVNIATEPSMPAGESKQMDITGNLVASRSIITKPKVIGCITQ